MLLSQVRQTARPHCTTGEHRDKRKKGYEGYHLCSVVGGRAFGRASTPATGQTRAGDTRHLQGDVFSAVLSDDVPAGLRAGVGAAMSEPLETTLIDMALSISAAGGPIHAVKKQIYHSHGVDWALLLTLAEVLRINAATLALTAEQQIEQQAVQTSLGLS